MSTRLVFGTSAERISWNTGDGFGGMWPDGDGHAVPSGGTQALCGLTPPFLWKGPFDPASRLLRVCADCTRLAASYE